MIREYILKWEKMGLQYLKTQNCEIFKEWAETNQFIQ